MTRQKYQNLGKYGTPRARRAAIDLMRPFSDEIAARIAAGNVSQCAEHRTPAAAPAATPSIDPPLQGLGSSDGAFPAATPSKEIDQMTIEEMQGPQSEFDGFGYFGPAIKNTVSLAAVCAPYVALLGLPPDAREQQGLSREGESLMASLYGNAAGLSEPFDLPAVDGKPARRVYGILGAPLEVMIRPSGEIIRIEGDTVLFLPGATHGRIVAELREAMEGLAGGTFKLGIRYVFMCGLKPTRFNPQGWSWTGHSLTESKRIDPLAALRHQMANVNVAELKARQRLTVARPPLTIQGDVGPLRDGDPDAIPLGRFVSGANAAE